MKKSIAFILALVYFSFSIGATIHVNYCMGMVVAKELVANTSATCSICGMDKKEGNGCCRDEVTQLKIESDQDVPLPCPQMTGIFLMTPSLPTHIVAGAPIVLPINIAKSFTPPLEHTTIFVRNCVFRI